MTPSRTLPLWSQIAHVRASLPGPGRIDLYAAKPAGSGGAVVLLEGYGEGDRLLTAGQLPVWEVNQALAALMADGSQARRLAVRDDGRGHPGYIDVVCAGPDVEVYVTSGVDRTTAQFRTERGVLTADLQSLLRHYLRFTRAVEERIVVLPDVVPTVVALPG